MLCKGVKRNFLFGERLEAIRDRSIYRLLYAFGKLKNSPPTAARHRAVVERILGVERIFFYSFLFSASSFLNHE